MVLHESLDLTIPANREIAARTRDHLGRLDEMRPLAETFLSECLRFGHVLAVVRSATTDTEQFKIWQYGRKLVNGKWVVVGKTRTRARTAWETAHGCLMAIDVAFCLDGCLVGPREGPLNDSWDPELPWLAVGEIGERVGFHWGGRWKPLNKFGVGWDAGHFQHPQWKQLRGPRPGPG